MDADKIAFRGMSIHKIYPLKEKLDSQKKIEQFIDTIIHTYNYANSVESEWESSHDFTEVQNLNWDVEKRKFHARIFFSKRSYKTGFAKWLSVTQDAPKAQYGTKTIHFVCFLYRLVPPLAKTQAIKKTEEQWEIFALTTNDGGHVVKRYADYRFPLQVTVRLVEAKFSHKLTKPLAGPKDSSSETYREEYLLKQNEMETAWQLFKEFNSHFKLGSSLYNPQYGLTAFLGDAKDADVPLESLQESVGDEELQDQKPQEAKDNKVSVEVGVGKIVIGKSMTMRQYEEVLEHFSLISRGIQTTLIKDDKKKVEKEDTAFRHLENIQHVQIELVPKLNNVLLELVWSYYNKEPLNGELNFTHRYQTDFYGSCEFSLKYSDQVIFWNYRPSLSEVLEVLRQLFVPVKSKAQFFSLIGEVKFKFNRKNRFFPLKEFFHGELRYNENTYFHIDGFWLQVKNDHLARLSRSFYEFLQTHLLVGDHPAQLPKPWYAKAQWIAFGPDDLPKGIDKLDLEDALKRLEEERFSFLDEEGNVLCPYPTQCLLEDHGFGIEFTRTLQKNWESLRLLLLEKQKDESPLEKDDLKKFFEGKSKGDPTFPEKLLKILKDERKVLSRSSVRLSKVTVLRQDSTPLITDISSFSFKAKSITANVEPLNQLLEKRQKEGKPCTQEDVKEALPGSHKRFSNVVHSQLSQPVSVKSGSLEGSRYLVHGPIPEEFEADDALLEFFKVQHEKYQLVLREEGYNRLYLKEKQFLVCDQIYAGKKENVELFDIMQFGVNGKTYLYHVKEGFGQKTGEACRQIRVAAVNIRDAIKSGDYKILRKLYDQATGSQKTSPFGKAVKESLENLPHSQEDKQDSDRFTKLFPIGKNQICFVYAFIDDAEKKERFLEDEKNPNHTFQEEDFLPLEKETTQSAKDIYQAIKVFLGEYGQLKDDFLLMTEEKFCWQMKDKLVDAKKAKKVYLSMRERISQFDSLGAKIELLYLRDFLRELGFDFQVCQIRRSKERPADTDSPRGWTELPPERWESVSSSPHLPFTYKGVTFIPKEPSLTLEEVLCHLFKIPHQTNHLKAKAYELFLKHKIEQETLFKEYFEEMKKHKKLAPSKQEIFSTYEDKQYGAFFDEFLNNLIYSFFQFEEQELRLIVKLLHTKVTIFTMDTSHSIAVKNPHIFAFDEKSAEIGQVIVKDRSHHYQFCIDSEHLEEVEEEEFESTPLNQTLPHEIQEKLLSQKSLSGLKNVKNDCFFNSIVQMLFHSQLFSHLVDESALVESEEDNLFFPFIYELALNYGLAHEQRERDANVTPITSYPSDKMRNLLKFSSFHQEDAAEALTRILGFYDTEALISQFTMKRTVDPSKKKPSPPNILPDEHSPINPQGILESPDSELILKIPFLKGNDDLETMIEAVFQPQQIKGTLHFVFNKKCYQVSEYNEEKVVNELKETLFIQLERFRQEADQTITKDRSKVLVKSTCEIKGQTFEIKSFIVHIGDTPNSGHYIAYCKTSQGWFCFNDSQMPQELHVGSALEKGKDAYLLHYQIVDD